MLKTWRNNFVWEGGGRSVISISQTCDQERFEARKVIFFSWECLDSFATGCLSPSYGHTPYSLGARLLNGVRRGAFFAPKEVVIKNSVSFS